MKIKEFAFVAYAVKDMKRARRFYEKILGFKPGSVWRGKSSAFVEYYLGADTLALGFGSDEFRPGKTGATVALEVSDFDAWVQKLKKAKVRFLMECFDTPVCRMVLIQDTEGNQLMLHERKGK